MGGNWFEGQSSARYETRVEKVKLELNDSVIRGLKPESKKYTVWDTTADPTGLGVRIRPTGVKTYVVRARPRPTDRQIMVTLGRAGTLKLGAARKAAWDALQQMQRGLNPNDEKHKLDWPPGQRMLDTMIDAGLDAPYSCREGVCGACACRLLEGEVEMAHNEVLEAADLADGYILACQSVALTDHVAVDYS